MDHPGLPDELDQISEINLTPLMDLTFILLITFIITFPLIEQGIPLNLPQANAADLDHDASRTISVRADRAWFLDETPVSVDELRREMTALGESGAGLMIYVRADETIPYAEVVKVLRILQQARLSRVALVTRSEGGEAP